MKEKIAILGFGNIGKEIYNGLVDFIGTKEKIIVIDNNDQENYQKRIDNYINLNIIKNREEFFNIIKNNCYITINCLPHHLTSYAAKICIDGKSNYFDFTEDTKQVEKIRKYIIKKNIKDLIIASHCGLAPGLVSIITNNLLQKHKFPYTVTIATGAIPSENCDLGNFRYLTTWSIEGLVNEYLSDCDIIENYQRKKVPALSKSFGLNIFNNRYEASLTSGGIGTLCETYEGKIKEMSYSSIRHVGHFNLIKFLLDDLNMRKNKGKKLIEIIKEKVPSTLKDQVLIYIHTTGFNERREMEVNRFIARVKHTNDNTALQLCTVNSCLSLVELFLKDKIKPKGFLKQEEVDYNDFQNCYFFKKINFIMA